jgi:hypothetical protein
MTSCSLSHFLAKRSWLSSFCIGRHLSWLNSLFAMICEVASEWVWLNSFGNQLLHVIKVLAHLIL